MVTDTIGNFIIKIKNANLAGKDSVSIYTSKMKEQIAETLKRAGYIESFSKNSNGKTLDVVLKYKTGGVSRITGAERVSRPSRRVYQKSEDIKPFKNGFGSLIISTSSGVLSDKEAIKQKVGGEVLFKIW